MKPYTAFISDIRWISNFGSVQLEIMFKYSQEQARCLFHKELICLWDQEQARCLFHKELICLWSGHPARP
jgi:hypothetical protein